MSISPPPRPLLPPRPLCASRAVQLTRRVRTGSRPGGGSRADPLANPAPGAAVRARSVGAPYLPAGCVLRGGLDRLVSVRRARRAPGRGGHIPRTAVAHVLRCLADAVDLAPGCVLAHDGYRAGGTLRRDPVAGVLGPRGRRSQAGRSPGCWRSCSSAPRPVRWWESGRSSSRAVFNPPIIPAMGNIFKGEA